MFKVLGIKDEKRKGIYKIIIMEYLEGGIK